MKQLTRHVQKSAGYVCLRLAENCDIQEKGFFIAGRSLTLRRLMSYIYGAPILDVSRSHTTTQHSR